MDSHAGFAGLPARVVRHPHKAMAASPFFLGCCIFSCVFLFNNSEELGGCCPPLVTSGSLRAVSSHSDHSLPPARGMPYCTFVRDNNRMPVTTIRGAAEYGGGPAVGRLGLAVRRPSLW